MNIPQGNQYIKTHFILQKKKKYTNLSRKDKIISTMSKYQPRNTAAYVHGNLNHLSVPTSRVTYFILQAHKRAGVSHSQRRKNSGEVLKTMQVNGPGGYKLAKEKSLAAGVARLTMY